MKNIAIDIKSIMNEFIIFRMEEELNLLSCLIKQNEEKINNKKINLNFFYKSKCSTLNKEYEYKNGVYEDFIKKVESNRIDEANFDNILKNCFIDDGLGAKKYCFFLQTYFTNLYSDSNYEERNRLNSLKEIASSLDIDENILEFVKKSIKKNIKIVDNKSVIEMLTNKNMIFDVETFYPFASDIFGDDIEMEKSLLSMQILNDKLSFVLPNNKTIIDVDSADLKKALLSFLLIYDYIKMYSLKNYKEEGEFVSSLLKCKNQYEGLVIEKQVHDYQKEDKLVMLNKVIEEIGSN